MVREIATLSEPITTSHSLFRKTNKLNFTSGEETVRGKKAKRLRKLGLKSGPQKRPELTEDQRREIIERQNAARAAVGKPLHDI